MLLGTAFKLHKSLSSAAFRGHHSSLGGQGTPRWRQDPHEDSLGSALPDPHLLYLVPKSSCSALPRQIIAGFLSHAGKSSCMQHVPLSPWGMENWHFLCPVHLVGKEQTQKVKCGLPLLNALTIISVCLHTSP